MDCLLEPPYPPYTFSADYHNPPEGAYKLYVALETTPSELFHAGNAEELKVYNFYVGSSNYYLDVDVEYIYQTGLDILHYWNGPSSSKDDFGYVTAPFSGTRVAFSHAYSPKNPVPRSSVAKTPQQMNLYKLAYASFWDSAQTRQIYPYVLCAIDYFEDAQGHRLTDILGASQIEYKVAIVAVGQIEANNASQQASLKQEAACHELAHIVGGGLTDYCEDQNHHATNSQSSVCLMTGSISVGSVPYWGCNATNPLKQFDPNFYFCDSCKNRLNDINFLFPGGVPKKSEAETIFIPLEEK